MHKPVVLAVLVLIALSSTIVAQAPAGRFDGQWTTTLTCPPKGNTDGYTWHLPTVIQNNNLHAERGTAGEGGYFVLDGKIGEDGKAKLAASGIVASRQYARGVFARKGEEYSYNVKAEFKEKEGTGKRDEGLGIVGRPCTFDFVKLEAH